MKKYVYAMSAERSKLKYDMQRLSHRFSDHLIKCCIYGNTLNSYNHWIEDELATWLAFVNDITCKPNNKKLKVKDYQSNLFADLGDDLPEAKLSIYLWIEDNKRSKEYPEVTQSEQELAVTKLHKISLKCLNEISEILASKNNMSKKDWESYLHTLFDPICK